MIRLAVMCCAIAASTVVGPLPAVADTGDTTSYDTIDAIEVFADLVAVTGIISGQGTSATTTYQVRGGTEAAARCDRLGLLAMAKPGKYRFAVTVQIFDQVSCKLIVRTP